MTSKEFEISLDLFNHLSALHGLGFNPKITYAKHEYDTLLNLSKCTMVIDIENVSVFDPRRFPQLIAPTYTKVSAETFWELDEEFESRELYHKPHGAGDYLLVGNYQTLAQAFENDCLYRKEK